MVQALNDHSPKFATHLAAICSLTAIFANNFQLITAVLLTSSIVQSLAKSVYLQITAEAYDVAERWSVLE
jgi:hypothetical protein